MGKIIDIKNDDSDTQSAVLKRILEESAQEDLDEKIRGNKRKTKWDFFYSVVALLALFNACGIVSFHIDLSAMIPLAVKIFQYVPKINSS